MNRRHFLGVVGTVGIAATSGCLSSPDPHYEGDDDPDTKWWPQPQFDSISSCYNPEPVGPREGVRERWSLDISSPSECPPVVADGLAFLPTADALRAVDAKSGDEQWRETGGDGPTWPRSVLYRDGLVYVALEEDPGLLALDAKTGEVEWSFSPEGYGIGALLLGLGGNRLFAGDGAGYVYGLDPATGERQWSRRIFGGVLELAQGIPELFAATEAGEVYALGPDDGDAYWRGKVEGWIRALATGNGDGVFVGAFGGPTVELSGEKNGGEAWTNDVWASNSFVVSGGTAFAAGHELVALDTNDGSRQWTAGTVTDCGPAAAGDTVYAASEGEISGYKFGGGVGFGAARFGTKRWSHSVEGTPQQGLVVADGAVFALTRGDKHSKAYALEEA